MEDFLYSKEGSEERLKIEKIIKAQQPEVYKQLKKDFLYSKEGSEERFEDRKNN